LLTPDFVKLSHNGASDAQASVYLWVGVAIHRLVQASPNFKLILDHSNTLLSGPFNLCLSLFVLCWELKSEYAICRGNIRIFNHIIFIFFYDFDYLSCTLL